MKNDKTSQFNRTVRANGPDDGKRWDEVGEPVLIEIPVETDQQRNNRIMEDLRKKIGGMPSSATSKAPAKPSLPN